MIPDGSSATRDIVVFHPEGNADNNPTLYSWLRALSTRGFRITVIARRREHQSANNLYRLTPYGRWYSRIFRFAVDEVGSSVLAHVVTLLRFPRLLRSRARHIVGVDRYGLIQASSFRTFSRGPLGFFSFEIEFESEIGHRKKRCERRAARDVTWWVSQDAMRAELLCRENRLTMNSCVTTPVASAGRLPESLTRLRDDLGVPKEARVVMSMGSLAAWTMVPEILRTVAQWPSEWVLIVHERYAQTASVLNSLAADGELPTDRIFISSHRAVTPDDLAYVLAGVDLGLAFYREQPGHPLLGQNLRFMGRSSGKIATFARHGVPVVTNLGPPVSADLARYSAGYTCNAPHELPALLRRLPEPAAQANAFSYFDEILDFNLAEQQLLHQLETDV